MTLEESKEDFLKKLNKTNQLILGAYKNAVERLNKETQELQEQNAELMEMLLQSSERLYTVESPSTSCRYLGDEITKLLTKYNQLNKKQ